MVSAGFIAVHVDPRTLAHALKFKEHLAQSGTLGQYESLAIPRDPRRMPVDVNREGVVFVPGSGKRERLPVGVIKLR